MPIIIDNDGKIIYTTTREHWNRDDTDAHSDEDFSVVDKDNVVKQVDFDIVPTTPDAGTVTLQVNVGSGDSTIVLGSGGSITGDPNTVMGFDGSGNPGSIPGFNIYTNTGGLNQSLVQNPDNASSGFSINSLSSNVNPIQNSPNDGYNLTTLSLNIDTDSDGFSLGTNGTAVRLISASASHQGTSDIGSVEIMSSGSTIGNGTDPIDVKGLAYYLGFGGINANVNLTGPLQGFIFQPGVNAAATMDTGGYVLAFADNTNLPIASNSYQSASFSPTIGSINNNNGYTGVNINPTISAFTGNAGANGIGISGNFDNFGTGGFNGININPNVDNASYANGIVVNMNNSTATTVKAADFTGDVSIDGNLTFSGALSIGQLNAFYASNPVDGGGNPQAMHGLITSMTGLNGVTTANCDAIGVNTAMLITLQANSVNTSGAFGLGFSALALPCVVETHTGSSLDYMSAAVYAVNLSGTSTGGTIDTVNLCRSVMIPNGITTINKIRGFYSHQPFGLAGTQNWGFYEETGCENFFKASLKIGGTVGSTDVVTNSSVALEIESTDRTFVNARMTTTQKNALTAINGMQVYDTDLDKLQVYAAGSWVSLH